MNEKKHVPESCVGKPVVLADMIDYADGSIVSKTLIDKTVGTITLFAFDRGQKLSEHTAPYDAVVQIIDGSADITIGGKLETVCAGQLIVMPANIPHAVAAKEQFKMMLVMIQS
jgi:quercetin dioxygenase-like cupin family protein